MSFDWKLAIGDDELDPRELKRLARLKMPLVQVRGQWVEIDARGSRRRSSSGRSAAVARASRAAEALRVALAPIDRGAGPARRRRSAPRAGWPTCCSGSAKVVPAVAPFDDARRIRGSLARVPGARRGLADFPGDPRAGRLPRRRHGPGQDDPVHRLSAGEPAAGGRPAAVAAGLPDLGHRELASASSAVRAGLCRSMVHHGPDRRSRQAPGRRGARTDVVLTTYSLLDRDESSLQADPLGRHRARRGPEREEPGHAAGPGRAHVLGRVPLRDDRHAGREPPVRALGDRRLPESRLPGLARGVQALVRGSDRALARRRPRRRASQAGPAVRAAPGQVRPERDPGSARRSSSRGSSAR